MRVAVIAARDEEETVGPLVGRLAYDGWRVVVVDGMSGDGTAAAARAAGATVLVNEDAVNQGIGPCVVLGWRWALAHGAECVLTIDAGGSHDPAEWPELMAVLLDGADVVIGSRFGVGGRYVGEGWRPLLSRAAAGLCNGVQSGARWSDWTSGYRLYSAAAVRVLMGQWYKSKMHGWQIEVLGRAGAMGLQIGEAPITYTPGRSAVDVGVVWEALGAVSELMHHIGPVRQAAEVKAL